MLKSGQSFSDIQSKREGGVQSPAPAVALIYILSWLLAWLLAQGPWKTGSGFKTGHSGIDGLFFSSSTPSYIGDRDIDGLIHALVQALPIFLATGFLPFLTFLWVRLTDNNKMNIYRSFWGVSVGIFTLFFLLKALLPALGDAISIIIG